MSTFIICLILLLICFIAIRSMRKRATSGCCDTGDQEKRIKVKDKNKSHYPYQLELKVSGIHCQNCCIRIENAFNKKEGTFAKVNTDNNVLTILSKEELDSDQCIETVKSLGYIANIL